MIVLLALLASVGGAELALRGLLFSDLAAAWDVARQLRDPRRFARWRDEDAFWVLQYLWSRHEDGDRGGTELHRHDDRVGWLTSSIEPGTYAHADEVGIGGRRPILLLGDSFAACVTPQGTCFETLVDESSLGRTHALLNYGVHGYGLDQAFLLVRGALERFVHADPIVVIGVYLDDDLDRCALGFRGGPKPRLRVQDGRLRIPTDRVPTVEEYLAGDLPLPDSYLLAWLRTVLRRAGLVDDGDSEAEKRELTRLILAAIIEDLRSRDLGFFFLLFTGPQASVEPEVLGWRRPLVLEELSRQGATWVEVREGMVELAAHGGEQPGALFKAGDIHLNEAGNRAAFRSLLRGLEACGVEAPQPLWPLPPLWSLQAEADEAGGGFCRYERAKNLFLGEPDVASRLLLRGAASPARASYALAGRCSRFQADARAVAPGDRSDRHELRILVDGALRSSAILEAGGSPTRVEVDLQGAELLQIEVASEVGSRPGSCVVLSRPVLE